MKKTIKIIMLLTLTTLTTPCMARTVTYDKIGDVTYGSDGTVIEKFGDSIIVTTPEKTEIPRSNIDYRLDRLDD